MNGTTLNTQNEYQIHQNEIGLHETWGISTAVNAFYSSLLDTNWRRRLVPCINTKELK